MDWLFLKVSTVLTNNSSEEIAIKNDSGIFLFWNLYCIPSPEYDAQRIVKRVIANMVASSLFPKVLGTLSTGLFRNVILTDS